LDNNTFYNFSNPFGKRRYIVLLTLHGCTATIKKDVPAHFESRDAYDLSLFFEETTKEI